VTTLKTLCLAGGIVLVAGAGFLVLLVLLALFDGSPANGDTLLGLGIFLVAAFIAGVLGDVLIVISLDRG
jgi:hypothetical protein